MILDYIEAINSKFITGKTTEHSFRGDLETLLKALISPEYMVINEPKRQTSCGAPDYIIQKKEIPVGFIEAKDIGDNDLEGKRKSGNKEQFDRYKASLNNIIFTNYLDFYFYQDAICVAKVSIGEITPSGIKAQPENFSLFESLIQDFSLYLGQTIKSPQKLAKMMANKAKLLAEILEKAVTNDEDNHEDSTLKAHYESFQHILIHDITPKGFADVYAQTIAYGMFAARLYDSNLSSFSRQEAAELIPKSNPFLRKLFGYIAGPEIDDRIKWIVDSLADIFLHCNVQEILKSYGRSTRMNNPIIHFYETFLSEYDPTERKKRGVWYTPEPVVNFIVRAVDQVLKTEFGLSSGLADTATTTIKIKHPTNDRRYKDGYISTEKDVHRVQILDPATGTGTFLSQVIQLIYQDFEGMQGIWSDYVEKHLIPRLNGFELLMASYAMAHLQLNSLLAETGYVPNERLPQRLKVYLTNSLEQSHPDTGTLFANWLSSEANEANHIKRDTPVMCIMGNPPYSGVSSNNGQWIADLIEDYKYVDGVHFNERKHWLNDDYVKFIRLSQDYIDKNGEGVLAFISPHGFLDNPTFRGMRWSLLNSFNKIYTLDLHGNSHKKEVSPDGSLDQNVFDIMQGVCITIFIKTKSSKKLGEIFHYDLYGSRESKYQFLLENNWRDIAYQKVSYSEPYYFFVPKDDRLKAQYDAGFKLDELFPTQSSGIVSMGDHFILAASPQSLMHNLRDFLNNDHSVEQLKKKYKLGKNYPQWITDNKEHIRQLELKPIAIHYRPFDQRYTIFDNQLLWRPRSQVMAHYLHDNVGLLTTKGVKDKTYRHIFIGNAMSEAIFLSGTTATNAMNIPLYLYQQDADQNWIKTPNLDLDVVHTIAEKLQLRYQADKGDRTDQSTLCPVDLLDYVYAVLHSKRYCADHNDFLKLDFPRVPYPQHTETFWTLVDLGHQLRQLHLMQDPTLTLRTHYPERGDNLVEQYIYQDEKIHINDQQYFSNVPEQVWNFYIGGYQPAQKWLKDRKGQILQFEDIRHYQKILSTLEKTDSLMDAIDTVLYVSNKPL